MHLKAVSKHCSEMQAGEVKVKASVFPSEPNVVLIPGLGFSTQKQCPAVNAKHLSSSCEPVIFNMSVTNPRRFINIAGESEEGSSETPTRKTT